VAPHVEIQHFVAVKLVIAACEQMDRKFGSYKNGRHNPIVSAEIVFFVFH
jgi:hypothetical protein